MLTMKKKDLTLQGALDEFDKFNYAKGLVEKTILEYRKCIVIFIDFVGNKNAPISKLEQEDIINYTIYLRQQNISKATINTRLRSLRTFINFCADNNYVEPIKVQLIKQEQTIKPTYSDEELQILLTKPNIKKCDFDDYRTWVVENYLLATGNRLSTIIHIKICDLDIPNKCVTLKFTKSKKEQIIPIPSSMCKILIEYLDYRKGEPDDYLFSTNQGQQLTINGFEAAVRRYNLRHGVTKTSVHEFRHTYAKKFIMAGGDAFRLQALLGHSDLTITKNYVNMFSTDLQVDYDKFNPLENLRHGDKNYIKISK